MKKFLLFERQFKNPTNGKNRYKWDLMTLEPNSDLYVRIASDQAPGDMYSHGLDGMLRCAGTYHDMRFTNRGTPIEPPAPEMIQVSDTQWVYMGLIADLDGNTSVGITAKLQLIRMYNF